MLKQVVEHSPRGQLEQAGFGNGINETRGYNARTGQITAIDIDNGAVADLTYGYDAFGNLTAQGNGRRLISESYTYDRLHRLIERTSADPAVNAASYRYDALGNITHKSDYANTYSYGQQNAAVPAGCMAAGLNPDPGPHAVTELSGLVAGGPVRTLAYDHNGNVVCAGDGGLNVEYDPYNLPTEVQRSGSIQQFGYGPDLQRFVQQAGAKTTIYLDRSYEQVRGGTARFQIDEDVLVRIEPDSAPQVHYQHRNRLGSIIAVTDSTGQLLADTERGYDPWGRPRDADWVATDTLPGADVTPRGFTDHEHIDGSRLIHMNGRAFDPLLGRFLSVDPVIQFPENSQSLNPYSYIMNNPMAGTDPTGYQGAPAGGGCATGTRLNIPCGARGVRTIGVNTGGSLTASNGVNEQSTTQTGGGDDLPDALGEMAERTQSGDAMSVDGMGNGVSGGNPGPIHYPGFFPQANFASGNPLIDNTVLGALNLLANTANSATNLSFDILGAFGDFIGQFEGEINTINSLGPQGRVAGGTLGGLSLILSRFGAINRLARATKGLSNLPFRSGDVILREFQTSKGILDVAAETQIVGRTLRLNDVAVFPRGSGALNLGTREVTALRNQLAQEARELGFSQLRITGTRISGANPGKAVDVTIDLTRLER